ncbi:MAG: hypothetical protein ABSB15_08360 [Bryobacteraceae bacterium]
MNRSNLRWAGAVWILFLTILSLQPARLRATNRGTAAHFILHVVLFGLAAAAPLLLSENRLRTSVRALCVLCLAGAIEIAQGLIYRYKTEWSDFGSDGVGILIAFAAIRFWRVRKPVGGTGKTDDRNAAAPASDTA